MRKIITALIFLLAFPAYAETSKTETSTKIESSSLKTGTVSIKSYLEIGEMDTRPLEKLSIYALEIFYPGTKTKVQGLRIEVNNYQKDRTDVSFIDLDEIDDLLKGIDYISEQLGKGGKFKMFEAKYITKSGFEITVFNKSKSDEIGVAIHSGIASIFGDDISALQKLRSLIYTAKEALNAK